jgi:hypothetical protein
MRRKARENAIKFIFEKLVNGSESEITYEILMEELSDDDIANVAGGEVHSKKVKGILYG